ncbi:MAG: hypothetical protein P4L40_03335 [Terracidiphilus sp.]|nr:hypothetical protein [Terracidiphilus sp.]
MFMYCIVLGNVCVFVCMCVCVCASTGDVEVWCCLLWLHSKLDPVSDLQALRRRQKLRCGDIVCV